MIETVSFNNDKYLKFQAEGNAAQFAIPFAKHLCKGVGVDVGCNRVEWSYPGSIPIDPAINAFDALNFPTYLEDLDYIFSSHCLEHLDNWVAVLDYWTSKLRVGGVLFLYLPGYSQKYWRPWNNRKHKNIFDPQTLTDYLVDRSYTNVYASGIDLNHSFIVLGERS